MKIFIYKLNICLWGIISFCALNIYGQSINERNKDSLNQIDSSNKKNGYWIDYLDNRLTPTKNNKKIACYRFVYYDHGFLAGIHIVSMPKNLKLKIEGDTLKENNVVLLNGKYSFYSNKGMIVWEEIYKEGYPIRFTDYDHNKRSAIIDFEKKYQNQKGSFYTTIYKKDGSVYEAYYFGKVRNRWKQIFEIKEK